MKERLTALLDDIRRQGNYRNVKYLKPLSSTRVEYAGREYLNLCSNSYLSLHTHPRLIAAAKEAAERYGAGICSSRSVSGSIDLYGDLEEAIASYKGYRRGLIFPTGYMANMAIVPTLSSEEDVIFSDELNHSSLIDAMRLSRAKKVIYRHKDMYDLERKINEHNPRGKKIIVTELVFSMDGDMAPLDAIYALKQKYSLYVYVDDAHGTGVFGERGIGAEEAFGLCGKMDVHMATFGKSFGSFGAFVLSDPVMIEFLINRARTFMYTTALPPAALGASRAAVELVALDSSYKDDLWRNIDYMRKGLIAAGFDLKDSAGPIIPIIVGEDVKAVKMQEMLLERGLFLQAIRPPTVAPGTSRLRFTMVRDFEKADLDRTLEALIDAGKAMKLIG